MKINLGMFVFYPYILIVCRVSRGIVARRARCHASADKGPSSHTTSIPPDWVDQGERMRHGSDIMILGGCGVQKA